MVVSFAEILSAPMIEFASAGIAGLLPGTCMTLIADYVGPVSLIRLGLLLIKPSKINKILPRSHGLRRLRFKIVARREERFIPRHQGRWFSQLKARSGSICVRYSDGGARVFDLVEPSTSVFKYEGLPVTGDYGRYTTILRSVLAHMMYVAFLSRFCELEPMTAVIRPSEDTASWTDDFGFRCLMSVSLAHHEATAQRDIAP